MLKVDSFDKDETEMLELSSAAVMYQEGGKFNAWTMFGAAFAGVVVPRFFQAMDQLETERERRKAERDMGMAVRVRTPAPEAPPPKETPQ